MTELPQARYPALNRIRREGVELDSPSSCVRVFLGVILSCRCSEKS